MKSGIPDLVKRIFDTPDPPKSEPSWERGPVPKSNQPDYIAKQLRPMQTVLDGSKAEQLRPIETVLDGRE